MRKAKNAPPWTRRKLVVYRRRKEIERQAERASAKEFEKQFGASGREIDHKLEGVRGVV